MERVVAPKGQVRLSDFLRKFDSKTLVRVHWTPESDPLESILKQSEPINAVKLLNRSKLCNTSTVVSADLCIANDLPVLYLTIGPFTGEVLKASVKLDEIPTLVAEH